MNARRLRHAWVVAVICARCGQPADTADEYCPGEPTMSTAVPKPDRLELWPRHRDDMVMGNQSPRTVQARQYVLARVTMIGGVDLADVQDGNVRALVARPTLSPASRKSYLSHLRTFYAWARFNELLDIDPCAKIKHPQVGKRLPVPIGHADLDRAVESARPNVRAWLLLAALAGLRCAEIAGLHSDNVQGDTLLVTGKGDKTRAIPIVAALAEELTYWPHDGYLFPGRHGGHVSPQHVSEAINGHLRSLGIRSTAHKARARFATDFYRVNQDVIGTKELLGHVNVETTMAYVQADRSKLAEQVARMPYVPKSRPA